MDFVEICNVCARKAIIEAAKRIINSDKVCHSYSDFNFGVTFLEHSVYNVHDFADILGSDAKYKLFLHQVKTQRFGELFVKNLLIF